MWKSVSLVITLLAFLGCAEAPPPGSPAGPASPSGAPQAIAAAKRCVERSPKDFASVWGSALIFEKATATPTTGEGTDVWGVYFPEENPRGKPIGLNLRVDLRTGECRNLPME